MVFLATTHNVGARGTATKSPFNSCYQEPDYSTSEIRDKDNPIDQVDATGHYTHQIPGSKLQIINSITAHTSASSRLGDRPSQGIHPSAPRTLRHDESPLAFKCATRKAVPNPVEDSLFRLAAAVDPAASWQRT